MKTRRLLCLLTALAMLLTLAPPLGGDAKAAKAATKVLIGQTGTPGYKNLYTASGTKSASCGSGTATYDGQSKTLTLTNCTVNGDMYGAYQGDIGFALYCDGDLTVLLEGNSTLSPDKVDPEYFTNGTLCGVYVAGDLTIKNVSGKSATLTAEPQIAADSTNTFQKAAGIYCGGKLTVGQQSGGTLTVTATGAAAIANNRKGMSCGVEAKGGVEMSSGTLKASGGSVDGTGKNSATYEYGSFGVWADGQGAFGGSAVVEAYSGTAKSAVYTYGACFDRLAVSGSARMTCEGNGYGVKCLSYFSCADSARLTAEAGKNGGGNAYGLSVGDTNSVGSVAISGGTVTANAGMNANEPCTGGTTGAELFNTLMMSGGTLTCNGGSLAADGKGNSYGLNYYPGSFGEISGGTITATSGRATNLSYGIYLSAGTMLAPTGGTITATGGEARSSCGFGTGSAGIHLRPTGGKIVAKGRSYAVTITNLDAAAPSIRGGMRWDGADLTLTKYYDQAHNSSWKYVELDATTLDVEIDSWAAGQSPKQPFYSYFKGAEQTSVTYRGRNGTSYTESETAPTEQGDYTVTVSYADPTISGSANFSVKANADPTRLSPATANVGEATDLKQFVSGNAGALSFRLTNDTDGRTELSADGVLTAYRPGTVTVRVTTADTAETASGTRTMNVTVKGAETVATIDEGDVLTKCWNDANFTLHATAADPGAGEASWYWNTSDSSVAFAVPKTGEIQLRAVGSTTVYAYYTSDTTEGTARLRLRVTPAVSIEGTALTWSAKLPQDKAEKGGIVIAAWYDPDGRMLGCAVESFTGDEKGNAGGTLTVGTSNDATYGCAYRLMLLDSATFAPICPSWES